MTSSVTCWIFIAISALLPACTRSDAPVGDAGTPPAPAVSMTRNDCFKASLELDRMLLEAGKSCASDGDCDCYNGGLMMRGCQWVARKEPLAQLKRRESALLASGCAPERTCPAFACRAACVTFRGEKKCLQRGGCEQTAEAFKEVLAAAPSDFRCTRDEDCRNYAPGLANCGGVTDHVTANKLAALATNFHAQKCQYVIQCAPRLAFHGGCDAGRCVERPGPER